MSRVRTVLLAIALGTVASGAAFAADFTPPRVGAAYGKAMEVWPDFTGAWDMTGGDYRLMFDPAHAYLEPDPAGEVGGLDFGPRGGSHLTAIPYKPEYQKEYMERVAQAKAGVSSDRVGLGCRPYGMPRVMSASPYGPQFVYSPSQIVILLADETRRVFMDGRPHPTGDLAVHTWDGHSVGRWEGDTLVIDTVNVLEGNYEQSDARHSDQIHVVERIRMIDERTLENQMTIEDPVMFTRPWVVTRQYRRSADRIPNLVNGNCGPDEQIDMSSGAQSIILPSERDGR
jgi:hypothetical protein